MIIKDTQGDYTPAPAGTHVARCISVIDMGTQRDTFEGRTKEQHRVMLAWELCEEMLERDGKQFPHIIHKEYTASLNKKATLRQHLDAWRGRGFTEQELEGFELANVIGAPCIITILHKENSDGQTRAKITSVAALMKGTRAPEMHNKPIHYDLAMGKNATFEQVPEWIRKKILNCLEWTTRPATGETVAEPEGAESTMEDTPF